MNPEKIEFSNLDRALHSLSEALKSAPRNDLERDGVIQRFEYTFELVWKTAKRVLESQGLEATSPKSVIRELLNQGWIQDGDLWIAFLKARNATSHTYKEDIAKDVFATSTKFLPEAQNLCIRLKQEIR
jgi:nucleotidyltransferase substrate binding protein (TIGR01987 family)